MEVNHYKKRKKQKSIKVQKIGEDVYLVSKMYDPWTGEVAREVTEPISLKALKAKRKEIEAVVADLDELIKDVDNA